MRENKINKSIIALCVLVGILIIVILYIILKQSQQGTLPSAVNTINSPTIETQNFDLQTKCATNAKKLFNSNWTSTDPHDILLDYSNHYNKSLNKCYMLVNYNFWVVEKYNVYSKSQTFYDVGDNLKLGELIISNDNGTPQPSINADHITSCDIFGEKCLSANDFISQINPFMNN